MTKSVRDSCWCHALAVNSQFVGRMDGRRNDDDNGSSFFMGVFFLLTLCVNVRASARARWCVVVAVVAVPRMPWHKENDRLYLMQVRTMTHPGMTVGSLSWVYLSLLLLLPPLPARSSDSKETLASNWHRSSPKGSSKCFFCGWWIWGNISVDVAPAPS